MTIYSPSSLKAGPNQFEDLQVNAISAARVRGLIDSLVGLAAPSPKTADYTLALADAGTCLEMNSSSGHTFFINTDANVNFDIGTVITFYRMGTGAVTVAATSPGTTTVRSPTGNVTIRATYSHVSARKRAANEWILMGDLS